MGGDYIHLSLHYHHQNDFCMKVCSDESHFNVLLIVRDKVTGQCPQTTTFEEKESRSGFEPRSFRLPALPLGLTGSQREEFPAPFIKTGAYFGASVPPSNPLPPPTPPPPPPPPSPPEPNPNLWPTMHNAKQKGAGL